MRRGLLLLLIFNFSLLKSSEWVKIGLEEAEVNSFIITDSLIYVGTNSQGVYKAKKGEYIWTHIKGPPNCIISLTSLNPYDSIPAIYTATPEGIYRLEGNNWVSINEGLSGDTIKEMDSDKDKVLYAAISKKLERIDTITIFKRTFYDNLWKEVYAIRNGKFTMRVCPHRPDTLYIGRQLSMAIYGIMRTMDGGKIWDLILQWESAWPVIITIPPQNPEILYVGFGYYICRSFDFGNTWDGSFFDEEWQDQLVKSLVVDPDNPQTLYGCGEFVYKSTDGGETWQSMGKPRGRLRCLALDKSTHILYASTSQGVWKYELKEGVEEKNRKIGNPKFEIYPNPFRTIMNLSYQIVNKNPINLEVYNTAGRLVRTLTKTQSLEPKTYTIKWDGRDEKENPLPSGVYFIKLETRGITKTEKVILTR